MSDNGLRLPRQVYRLRLLGLALGFLCVGAVFYDRGASTFAWMLLAFHAFIWPHVAWFRARASADPHRAERQHLLIDSALGGIFVALMHFSLLPSVLVITMLSMDKLGWGARFLARSSATLVLACAITAVIAGVSFRPSTTMPMVMGALPLMVAYPIAVASVSNRSGRLARERKEAVEQTAALREQLAHVARVGTLGEMAAGLAHELNQPLAAIHLEANAALATSPDEAESSRESLTRISEQALRAGDIVRRMRTYARRGDARRDAIDVDQLVQEVLALLDHDLRLGGIETAWATSIGIRQIVVDRIEIQQVLVNLIRNAIEAMTRPAVAVRRLTIRTEAAQDAIRISIADTGGGIDPADVARLFHPFQSTKPTGLGLGLSICQSLVEAHGGRVGAGPHPNGGALFFFEVPAAPAANAIS